MGPYHQQLYGQQAQQGAQQQSVHQHQQPVNQQQQPDGQFVQYQQQPDGQMVQYQQQQPDDQLIQQQYPAQGQIIYQQPQQYAPGQQQMANQSTTTTTTETVVERRGRRRAAQAPVQSLDYGALMQVAPTPPPPPPAPEPGPDYSSLMRAAPLSPPPIQPATVNNSSTTVTTTRHEMGGRARQAAAAQGQAQLDLFDRRVQKLLVRYSGSACPLNFPYFRNEVGYLCGGASHFVSNEEVDAMMAGGRPFGPNILLVNARVPDFLLGGSRVVPGTMIVAPPEEVLGTGFPADRDYDLLWAALEHPSTVELTALTNRWRR